MVVVIQYVSYILSSSIVQRLTRKNHEGLSTLLIVLFMAWALCTHYNVYTLSRISAFMFLEPLTACPSFLEGPDLGAGCSKFLLFI